MRHRLTKLLSGVLVAGCIMTAGAEPASAQRESYIGETIPVAFGFCPRGWAEANGQLLAVSSNDALFSLYGTTYGGDGRTTFGLPDLRGRRLIGSGTGPGLTPRPLGARTGYDTVTLTRAQMPSHNHLVNLDGDTTSDTNDPANAMIHQRAPGGQNAFYSGSTGLTNMNTNTMTNSGQSVPLDVRAPSLTMRWCIALTGIYPSRS